MAAKTVVEVQNLQVVRNGYLVLDNITLQMEEGSFLALIGPNGGGKTTLLCVLLGLIPAQKGTVRLFGLPPKEALRKMPGAVGYIPQNPLLNQQDFPVSSLDVVLMGKYGQIGLGRWATKSDRKEALDSLRLVEMADLANRPLSQLSGGQRQRVFIARSLITKPKLLLLDEPTTGVDVTSQENFYQLLKTLQITFGLSVIMVSHDIALTPAYCDSVACLNQHLYLHGKPAEVLRSESLQEAYGCKIDFIFHGPLPHRVLEEH